MENMKKLYEKVAKDSALQEKFNEIVAAADKNGKEASEEKLIAFAKESGFDVTVEEMRAFFKELENQDEKVLSDLELDMVAGGKKMTTGIFFSTLTAGIWCAVVSIKAGNCADSLDVEMV